VFTLHFGSRTLDDDVAWAGLEDQAAFGLEYSTRGPSGLGFDLGLFFSTDTVEDPGTGIDVTGSLLEVDFGGRYTYAGFSGVLERFHPYAQAGLAMVAATIEAESGGIVASDEDGSLGLYLGAGAYAVLGSNFLLGIDARVLRGSSIELVGISTDADYSEVTLFLGWGF
jgi:hypothetical protein